MASPDRPILARLSQGATTAAALTDDLLEEIFLRIGSPADLARASAACVAFRRLIADPSFLHLYRSLHPPLLLGFVESDGFRPAEAPHPSAALGRAVARAADFSFNDYLPRGSGYRWSHCDVQDGRVLLMTRPEEEDVIFFPDLAVCDPLSRRYLLLPPIPDDLLASFQVQKQNLLLFNAVLVPSGDKEDDSSFRVLARMNFVEVMVVFIFSSGTGLWSAGTSVGRNALRIPLDVRELIWSCSYVYGCFYFKVISKNMLFKFNMSSMEFSTVDLPSELATRHFVTVESGEGRLGIFSKVDNGTLCYTIRQIGDKRFDQLKMDNMIPLPVDYTYYIDGPFHGYIFILGHSATDTASTLCFSLEIKTLKIERVCQMNYRCFHVCPYFGFPPSMSQRRI